MIELVEQLKDGAKELGIELAEDQVESFLIYLAELRRWSDKINLTAIYGESEIISKLFLDSFTLMPYIGGGGRLLDMGSGAGFPGLALKILVPGLDVVLLDSKGKKVIFLRHMIRSLALSGASAIQARAEEPEIVETLSNSFDFVVSRAFSDLSSFTTLAKPYLKAGGLVIAEKGPVGEELTRAAEAARGESGLLLRDIVETRVPGAFIGPRGKKRQGEPLIGSLVIFEKA